MLLLILIVLLLLAIASTPRWYYSTGWGYYPVGTIGTVIFILLIVWALRLL